MQHKVAKIVLLKTVVARLREKKLFFNILKIKEFLEKQNAAPRNKN